jgi:hypothetical protein
VRKFAAGLAIAVVALATTGIAFADESSSNGPAVAPTEYLGNPSCDGGVKIDPVTSGVHPVSFDGFSGTIKITVEETDTGPAFAFETDNPSHHVTSVYVKGGKNANLYTYVGGVAQDSGLRAPFGAGPGGSKSYGLSHLCFFTDKK